MAHSDLSEQTSIVNNGAGAAPTTVLVSRRESFNAAHQLVDPRLSEDENERLFGKCARLHGHNYRAAVEVEGRLDCNFYVFDFIAIKHRTKAITDELDHRMLLPTQNPLIALEETPGSVRVRYREREWRFPREDCVLLPIENTTAELLARYIARRLLADLRSEYQYEPRVLRVEVEENIGQSATVEFKM